MDGETELSIMPFESRVNLATPSQPPDTINYTICDDANNDIAYAVSIIERGVVITPNGNGARKLIEVRPNLARRAEINILMLWCKMSEMINSKSLLIMTVSIARLIYLKIRGKSLQSLEPNTNIEMAAKVLDRVRVEVNKHKFSKPVEKSVVTVSIGLATVSDSKLSAEESIKWADKVIDEAKDTGRNKCVLPNSKRIKSN